MSESKEIKADIEKRIDDFIEKYAYENKKVVDQLNIESMTLSIAHLGIIILLRDGEEIIGSCLIMNLPDKEETIVIITGYYGEGTEQIH